MAPDFESFYPQGSLFHHIHEQIVQGSLVHGLLITGPEGVGKKTFASLVASALLCVGESGDKPCGHCPSCLQFAAETHPDMIRIRKGIPLSPEVDKDRATIPIQDIREMIRLTGAHAYKSGNRVVLITDADSMTREAQNALLKTLEEPPEKTWFILLTAHREMLLSTIISRCRPVAMHPWSDDYVRKVLRGRGVSPERTDDCVREAGGSVGMAIRLATDENYWRFRDEVIKDFFNCESRSGILTTSTRWKERKGDSSALLDLLDKYFDWMMTERVKGFPEGTERIKKLISPEWARFAENCELSGFTAMLDYFAEARKQLVSSVNFQAVIEQIMMKLMEAKSL